MLANLDLVAIPREKAAALAGISQRRLRYWHRKGLVAPTIESHRTSRPVYLYAYQDLLAVLVLVELKARGVRLQHVRRVVPYVRALGYSQPLTEVCYAIHGGEIHLQHPDGGWEGDRRPGQGVLPEVLELEPLRARIQRAVIRPEQQHGSTERRSGTLGGKEVFAGTRVPVSTVQRYLDMGASVEQVLTSFPALDRADVDEVISRRAS
ncbi:DUF433 domain-containing protein [Georgenia sp. TF02-10]|uniref:DUF433 domain-containing protein n=1 Tax=Georgenia sp. TF02-10 TaxID=2917725 RepID=UPI001FA72DD8|nr:DUF433 domain-containing protein [Georgenia sp. TF02-10]UNX55151.1 DUF433 domain-containing protein [Georgenia sp. TF02-10]